jgi:hypothetical protein
MLDTSAPGQFGTKTVRHPDNSALVFFSLILRTKLPIMEIQYSYSPTVKRLICFHNGYFWFEQSVTYTGRGVVLAIFYVFYPIILRSSRETFVSPHYYFTWTNAGSDQLSPSCTLLVSTTEFSGHFLQTTIINRDKADIKILHLYLG